MFENAEIPIDELPRAIEVEWQHLHPRYALQLAARRALTMLFVLLVIVIVSLLPGVMLLPWFVLWPAFLLIAACVIGWPRVAVQRLGYAVRGRDIVYRSGVLFRSVTAIPFNRVQHVETTSTPFDRSFGTANLQIYTAGGSGGDLSIRGLPAETAERLRAYILEKIGGSVEER
jgi:uncharacterized protein